MSPLSIQQSPPLYIPIARYRCIYYLYSVLYGVIKIHLSFIYWRLQSQL